MHLALGLHNKLTKQITATPPVLSAKQLNSAELEPEQEHHFKDDLVEPTKLL